MSRNRLKFTDITKIDIAYIVLENNDTECYLQFDVYTQAIAYCFEIENLTEVYAYNTTIQTKNGNIENGVIYVNTI